MKIVERFIARLHVAVAGPRQLRSGVLLLAVWLIALALGATGMASYYRSRSVDATVLDVAYETVRLVNLGGEELYGPRPWTLELSRWMLPVLAAVTVLGSLRLLLTDDWRWMRVRWRGGHIVICGLSRKGYLLANTFRVEGHSVVVIERNAGNGLLADCRQLGDLVIVGDATTRAVLEKAGVARASWVFAVSDNEGVNAEVAARFREMVLDAGRGEASDRQAVHVWPRCRVHLADPDVGHWLADVGVLDANDDAEIGRLEAFNVFELGAPILLDRSPIPTAADAADGVAPRLLVVGLGGFGSAVIAEAGRRWGYARQAVDPSLRVLAVALDATERAALLQVEHGDEMEHVDVDAHDLDVHDAPYRSGSFLRQDGTLLPVDRAYVCLDDEPLAIRAALSLRRVLPDTVPITVRVAERKGLGALLPELPGRAASHGGAISDAGVESTGESAAHPNVFAYPLLVETCRPETLRLGPRRLGPRRLGPRQPEPMRD